VPGLQDAIRTAPNAEDHGGDAANDEEHDSSEQAALARAVKGTEAPAAAGCAVDRRRVQPAGGRAATASRHRSVPGG
jgi:hypothetical protein